RRRRNRERSRCTTNIRAHRRIRSRKLRSSLIRLQPNTEERYRHIQNGKLPSVMVTVEVDSCRSWHRDPVLIAQRIRHVTIQNARPRSSTAGSFCLADRGSSPPVNQSHLTSLTSREFQL